MYLGAVSLHRGVRDHRHAPADRAVASTTAVRIPLLMSGGRFVKTYTTGIASSLSNPKAGVMAIALLPQFVARRRFDDIADASSWD